MKAVNIRWDTEENTESLPTEIEIPENIANNVKDMDDYDDEIGDYISAVTGFCHCGFEIIVQQYRCPWLHRGMVRFEKVETDIMEKV